MTDDGDGVRMEIRDDGRGFAADTAVAHGEPQNGIGLVGMRERIRLLGGRLELISGLAARRPYRHATSASTAAPGQRLST